MSTLWQCRKMFIGGLNWETTDQSLKEYFSQFGEVVECTVMRDGASGRSRGFGFLTFRDAKTVNIVMVKEHYLDGKIVRPSVSTSTKAPSRYKNDSSHISQLFKIDPKRAIPRDEQERTSKIFVGGVSQDATEQDFKEFFMQFGRVVDATLMIDKDTGRPRGFGFVTFDSESAVEATLDGPLEILGKPIEVKKAQPRGNIRDGDDDRGDRKFNRRGRDGGNDRFGRDDDRRVGNYDNSHNNPGNSQSQNQNAQTPQAANTNGMTPQMLAQYWQRMQQYFVVLQQQITAAQVGGMGGATAMGGVNPAMMQQMRQMQQMQAMQAMGRGQGPQGSPSPLPQSPAGQGMQGMNPAMMQQMQQMQQMQMQQHAAQGQSPAGFGGSMGGGSMGAGAMGPNNINGGNMGGGGFGGARATPGYNAQEQLMFEQQKYEQQQARRAARDQQQFQQYSQGGPTSWEGMYDDVPQPNMGGTQGGTGRGLQQGGASPFQGANGGNRGGQQNRGSQGPTPAPQSTPPANAPTGPKNAGKPGANYRGGGRTANKGFHPYARPQ
ncbi:MAG: hypothetical protein M1812_000211 [Candelaria pacifica]|nr:MAG: hypothetical protein M1812_000211 [Candelaria pacifica]